MPINLALPSKFGFQNRAYFAALPPATGGEKRRIARLAENSSHDRSDGRSAGVLDEACASICRGNACPGEHVGHVACSRLYWIPLDDPASAKLNIVRRSPEQCDADTGIAEILY
jgi:hypothetical protein